MPVYIRLFRMKNMTKFVQKSKIPDPETGLITYAYNEDENIDYTEILNAFENLSYELYTNTISEINRILSQIKIQFNQPHYELINLVKRTQHYSELTNSPLVIL